MRKEVELKSFSKRQILTPKLANDKYLQFKNNFYKTELEKIGPTWPELMRMSQDLHVWKKFLDVYIHGYANKKTVEQFLQAE